ncbi:MAG: hypothetical protein QE263_09220 [Vampirovibrionales bacterium]|nr:hypothetical protein [Vampirovibrionales bacterium]
MIQFGQAMPVVVYVDGEMAKNEAAVPKGADKKIYNYLLQNQVEGLAPIKEIEKDKIDYNKGNLTDHYKCDIFMTHRLNVQPKEDTFAFKILATNEDYEDHHKFNKNPTNGANIDQNLFLKAKGELEVFLNGDGDVIEVKCNPKQTEFQKQREKKVLPFVK